jgi:hypothetical protein
LIAEIPVVEDENELSEYPASEQSEVGLLNERVESDVLAHDIDTTREETIDDGTTEDKDVTTNAEENAAKRGRHGMKRRWNCEEIQIFNKEFETNLLNKTMPTAQELENSKNELVSRSTSQIRTRLNNIILGKQRAK